MTGSHLPPNWGYPSPFYIAGKPATDGMIWQGKRKATAEDITALHDAIGVDAQIDVKTLCGLYDFAWATTFDVLTALSGMRPSKMGGVNSQNYENQFVGESDGALFRKEADGDMWYINSSGDMVHGIPPMAGCYHRVYVGGGYYDNVEGVEPNSPADLALGQGEFYWDEARRLYDVK